MKGKKNFFYSILTLSVLLFMGVNSYGQGNRIVKNYQWKYKVDEHVNFTFNNYDCDLIIHTWDKPEIEYVMSVDATLKTQEDARRLDAFIEELEFSHSTGIVEFDNRFWTSKITMTGKKIITLKGKKTVRFKEYKMKGEVWIPEACALNLISKYSRIDMEELNGRLSLNVYNDKVYGDRVTQNAKINAKYSTLEFEDMKDIEAELYNTDIEVGKIGDLNAQSKYSNFKAGDAEKININAYNDKYFFGITGDIKFTDKYSDLNAVKSGHLELDCYNSTVYITGAEDLDLKSKYGKYEIGELRNLNISSGYTDKFTMGTVRALNIIESKYCDFKIGHLESSLLLKNGYSDKFHISETGAFKEMRIDGKYIDVEMALDKDLSYSFKADVKYGKLNINEEVMDVRRKIKEGSSLELEAVKGKKSDGMTAIFVNGYEMTVSLTEQL